MIKEAIGYANLEDFYEIKVRDFLLNMLLENSGKRQVWTSEVGSAQEDLERGCY